jgi:hypothetical protein
MTHRKRRARRSPTRPRPRTRARWLDLCPNIVTGPKDRPHVPLDHTRINLDDHRAGLNGIAHTPLTPPAHD